MTAVTYIEIRRDAHHWEEPKYLVKPSRIPAQPMGMFVC